MRWPALLIALTVCGICAATAAHADQMVRAGEWIVTDVVNGKPSGEALKICRTKDATIEEIFTGVLAKPGTTCSEKVFNTNGNTTTFELSCTINGTQVAQHGTHTWSGEGAYHFEYFTHYGGAGAMDIARSGDAKRLGPCQLGDIMQQN
jgi:hypothetical protein